MILGIETSTAVSSVALASAGGVIAHSETRAGRGHVEFLMPAIADILTQNGATIADVRTVAVGIGPGLFTGLRVGVATAKTIAQMRGIGVIAVTSLDNLARQAREVERDVCAVIDAKRGEVFAAFYRDGVAISDPVTCAPASLPDHAEGPTLFLGDAVEEYGYLFEHAGELRSAYPTARALCEIALERGVAESPALIEPLYLRKSEAEIKWEDRGVQPQRPNRVKIAGER